MNMGVFQNLIQTVPQFNQIQQHIIRKTLPILVVGLSSVHKANLIQAIAQQESPILVLTDDDQSARRLSEDFNQMCGQECSAVYPYRDFILRPIETVSREYEYLRLNVLSRLAKGELKAVFAGINAAMQYTIPKDRCCKHSILPSRGSNFLRCCCTQADCSWIYQAASGRWYCPIFCPWRYCRFFSYGKFRACPH